MENIAEIAERFKLKPAGRGEYRGTCIVCAYADAMVLRQGKFGPIGWCASCQDTASIKAALSAAGVGGMISHPESATRPRRSSLAGAQATWRDARPLTGNDPASKYLAWRLGGAITSPAFRYLRGCSHPMGTRHPALICEVVDAAGEQIGCQRIFLDAHGQKAGVTPAKACKGRVWGGAIRIGGLAPEIIVAEGPETAAAAGLLLRLPAWSAVSAGNLAKGLVLPPEVKTVVIAADHDKPGLDAAEAAARRWKAEGRAVKIIKPPTPGHDFADVLLFHQPVKGHA